MTKAVDRNPALDRIRTVTVILVVIYHAAYLFNSAGVVKNIPMQGIPAVDAVCYFLYPWFMCLLFLVAGISVRYSLKTRSTAQFVRERARKLIVPFFGGVFLLGWINGWVTAQYVDFFGGHAVPGLIKYLVYCLNIGPLWFLPELFAASMLLLLIRKFDREDRLWLLSGKAGLFAVVLLALPVWGSSFLLNMPVVTVFRSGIYFLMFLLGYSVFSHEEILEKLKRNASYFSIAAAALGCVQVFYFWGQNFASDACLQHPLTNLYLWVMILAVLGLAQRGGAGGRFIEYARKRSFALYVFHYPLMLATAYWLLESFRLPMPLVYLILLFAAFAEALAAYEIVSRNPTLRYFLLGIRH